MLLPLVIDQVKPVIFCPERTISMTIDTQKVLCGSCRIPLEGPAKPKAQDMFSCPKCGRSGTFENVMASAKAFVTELAARSLQESMRKSLGGSKFIKLESKPIPKKTHRFITDHKI
jgi:predicted RNA-binding Zn-ribbon protein involved in translation (DUF1610 family)